MRTIELYIFDRELNFKGILENYTSLRWIRKYFKCGEFELQCTLTTDSLKLLQREYIIYKKNGDEAGYIEYRNLKQDIEGKEILVVKGRFLTGYLNRRIIWETENLNCTTEIAMRTLVDHNCIKSTNTNRNINNLVLDNLNNFVESINYQVSYKNLLEEIENVANTSGLGVKTKLDIENKKLVFNIYKGLDRTVNQDTNPKCIFSKEFENILVQEYVDSLNNYKNVNLVAGAGEGSERKFTIVGNAAGLDRFELFTDARDLSNTKTVNDTEVVIPENEYISMLQQRGIEKLSECKEITTFDSTINLNSNLQYKVDFNLGDIVTCVSKKWDIIINTRITEIEEIYEQQGLSINVIFGNNIPTLIDKIKQNLK